MTILTINFRREAVLAEVTRLKAETDKDHKSVEPFLWAFNLGYCLATQAILSPSTLLQYSSVLEEVDPKISRLFIVAFVRATITTGSMMNDVTQIDNNLSWIRTHLPKEKESIHLASSEIERLHKRMRIVNQKGWAPHVLDLLHDVGFNTAAIRDIEYKLK